MSAMKERICLVTGSHAGIGYAIAEACLQAGASVMIHARKQADLDRAVAALGEAHGDRVAGVLGDLSEAATPARLVGATVERFGGLDALVNNAALLTRSDLGELDAEHIDAMFAVNFRAPMLLLQAAQPHLRAREAGGSAVNIGSINAHCGAPNLLVYSATKAALMTATRNISDSSLDLKMRINQINVGWTLTENEHRIQLSEGQPEDWLDRLPPEFAPRGMILKPEEVAAHTVFWLSDASAPANGQVYELEQYPLIGRSRISER